MMHTRLLQAIISKEGSGNDGGGGSENFTL